MARSTTKKTAPTKKAAAKKTAPAKKAAAKKTTARRSSAKKPSLNLGDMLLVSVDPRQNNGSNQAAGQVVRVLDTSDDRVNLRVLLDDTEAPLLMRNVPVLKSAPKGGSTDPFALRR